MSSKESNNKHPYIKRFIKTYLLHRIKDYRLGIFCLLITILITISLPYLIGQGINLLSQTHISYINKQGNTTNQQLQLANASNITINNKKLLLSNIKSYQKGKFISTYSNSDKQEIHSTENSIINIQGNKIELSNILEIRNELSKEEQKKLILLSLILISLAIILFFARSYSRILTFLPGRKIEEKIRNDFFSSVIRVPLHLSSKYSAGELISRGTNDIVFCRVMVSLGILHSINSFAIIGGTFFVMLNTHVILTLLILIPLPFIIVISYKQSKLLMKMTRRQQENLGAVSRINGNQLNAYNLIHRSDILKYLSRRTTKFNEFYLTISKKLVWTRTTISITLNSIIIIASTIILLYGGQEVIKGNMSYGSLISFLIYFNYMRGPLRAISFLLPLIKRGEASLERIFNVIDEVEESLEQEKLKKVQHYKNIINKDKNIIEIKNLQFQYPTQGFNNNNFQLLINNISLSSQKTYGIFGPVASGKTTLIKLLTGQIKNSTNKIFINNIDYNEISDTQLNKIFSCVFQNNRHFSGTLKENIHSINTEDDSKKLYNLDFDEAFSISQLKNDFDQFPKGLQTIIGEHGITLSGGQRQRLAILKALIKPHQFLVMDDLIASLDYKTSEALIQELKNVYKGGFIISSQRLTALINCDFIFVLDNGKIIAQGTHQELLENCQFYKDYYKQQKDFLNT